MQHVFVVTVLGFHGGRGRQLVRMLYVKGAFQPFHKKRAYSDSFEGCFRWTFVAFSNTLTVYCVASLTIRDERCVLSGCCA